MSDLAQTLFSWIAVNSAVALVLGIIVYAFRKRIARPELLHLLWLVVLIKLVTPAVLRIDAIPLPRDAPAQRASFAPAASPSAAAALPAGQAEIAPSRALAASELDPRHLALAVWLVGSILLGGRVVWRSRRLALALRGSRPIGDKLSGRVAKHAATLGIRAPAGRIVAARVSPMIYGWPHRPRLVLPESLVARLAGDELDALIFHELAHVARHDPWVRWVEVAVLVACWWNPLAWWARANLRRAEEQACDARVLRHLPQSRRAYADGIVKTIEFLAGHPRTPALATGADGTRLIKERLAMILNRDHARTLRRPVLSALLLGLFLLPVVPGFAERGDDPPKEPPVELLKLEQRQVELERKLLDLEKQRAELHRELERMRAQREEFEIRRYAAELRRSGEAEEAERMEAEAEAVHRRTEVEREREDTLMKLRLEMMQGEQQLREKQRQLEREHETDRERARVAEERAVAEYERAIELQERAQHDRERAYEQAEQAYHVKMLEEEIARLDRRAAEGDLDDDERREIEGSLRDLKGELERIRAERERGRAR